MQFEQRKHTASCAAACLIAAVVLLKGASGQAVEIARWRDNSTAAYSLCLDDYAAPYFGDRLIIDSVTANRGLTISFSTIAKYLTGAQALFGRHLAEQGHLLTNHSWNHSCNPIVTPDTIAMEFDSAKARIETEMRKSVPGYQCLYWQPPCGEQSVENVNYLRAHEYIGCRSNTFSGVNPYNVPDPFNIGEPCYQPSAGLGVLNGHVTSAIQSGNWSVRQAHCVSDDPGNGYGPIPITMFKSHMDFCRQQIDAGALWMAPVQDVLKYAMQRENFTVAVLPHDTQTMAIGFTTDAVEINPSPMVDNTYYDQPLTLLVTLPQGYEDVGVTQGGQPLAYAMDEGKVRFDADPWGGPVTVANGGGVAVGAQGRTFAPGHVEASMIGRRLRVHGPAGGQAVVSLFGVDGRLRVRSHVEGTKEWRAPTRAGAGLSVLSLGLGPDGRRQVMRVLAR